MFCDSACARVCLFEHVCYGVSVLCVGTGMYLTLSARTCTCMCTCVWHCVCVSPWVFHVYIRLSTDLLGLVVQTR